MGVTYAALPNISVSWTLEFHCVVRFVVIFPLSSIDLWTALHKLLTIRNDSSFRCRYPIWFEMWLFSYVFKRIFQHEISFCLCLVPLYFYPFIKWYFKSAIKSIGTPNSHTAVICTAPYWLQLAFKVQYGERLMSRMNWLLNAKVDDARYTVARFVNFNFFVLVCFASP